MLNQNFSIQEPSAAEKALITSSLNLFIIHNEKKITVTQLIKSAGVAKSVFYKYFESKEDLYAAILLNDELQLSPIFSHLKIYGTVSELLESYLNFRIQQIDKYRVLTRLEQTLMEKNCNSERYLQWQVLRRQHVDEFTGIVQSKMPKSKPIDAENIRFYYGLVWALASGFSQLSESDFFHELILDRRGFTRFLLESVNVLGKLK
ncbi:TetR/AcrR family transcriptional regulator [Reinekea marinisedimentorum]|uniref:AcrR family transcriptional regulator n=1 Tax=Reinekea marinisedimentorum TaxID=230495 RepID=A0A4R3IAU1_9GAMM|nr:TetR/AcrR family transcriptional regulator [Reinekea marinisedimentorum]TCS42550.1 AcrR family transcriptional regulator [Reinekea marinisedimentorum]